MGGVAGRITTASSIVCYVPFLYHAVAAAIPKVQPTRIPITLINKGNGGKPIPPNGI